MFEPTFNNEGLVPASKILTGLSPEFDYPDLQSIKEKNKDLFKKFETKLSILGPSTPSCLGGSLTQGFSDAAYLNAPTLINFIERELGDELEKLFNNQVVLDIGAGTSAVGYELAVSCGAKAYIAIEYCFAQELADSLSHQSVEKKIPYAIIYDNIATVLEAIPSNSVSFLLAAVDDYIFPGYEKTLATINKLLPHKIALDGSGLLYFRGFEKGFQLDVQYRDIFGPLYLCKHLNYTPPLDKSYSYKVLERLKNEKQKQAEFDRLIVNYNRFCEDYGPGGGEFGIAFRKRHSENKELIEKADSLDRYYTRVFNQEESI